MKKISLILISLVALLAAFCICTGAASGTVQSYTADLSSITAYYQMHPSTTQVLTHYYSGVGLLFNNGELNAPFNGADMTMHFEVSVDGSDFVFKEGNIYHLTVEWSGAYSHPATGGYVVMDGVVPSFQIRLVNPNLTSDVRSRTIQPSSTVVTEKQYLQPAVTGVLTSEVYTFTFELNGSDYADLAFGQLIMTTSFAPLPYQPYATKQIVSLIQLDGWTASDYPAYGWSPTPSNPEGSGSVTDHNQAEQDLITNSGVPIYDDVLSGIQADGELFVTGLATSFGVFSAMFQSFFTRMPDIKLILYVALLLGLFGLFVNLVTMGFSLRHRSSGGGETSELKGQRGFVFWKGRGGSGGVNSA